MAGVDLFTIGACLPQAGSDSSHVAGSPADLHGVTCVDPESTEFCTSHGGVCYTELDGYYVVSAVCIVAGALNYACFLSPKLSEIERVPPKQWLTDASLRANTSDPTSGQSGEAVGGDSGRGGEEGGGHDSRHAGM